MALIGTIRRNFWFVLILLGLALVAFLFMDIFGSNSIGNGAAGPVMGKVEGESISYNDFRRAESTLYRGSTGNQYAIQNSLWDFFVEKALVNKEADAIGIDVSRDELRDLQFGSNLHPMIQNNFRNPQTGQIDMEQLNQVKNAIDNDEFSNPEYRAFWAEQEKQIIKDQKQSKLSALVSKAMFTPTWMVNQINSQNTSNVSFDYVKVPFDYIPDTDIEVTDAAMSSYLKENAVKYTNDQETRRGEYIVFDVVATAADSMINKGQLENLIAEFKITPSDSLFAFNNNGSYSSLYAKKDDLPENLRDVIGTMNNGDIYGPYLDNGYYSAVKMINKNVVPDSIKARQIFRSVPAGDLTAGLQAQTLLDSILTELNAGRANFSAMAEKFSQDPGSSTKGGDLGYFLPGAQFASLPSFNNFCMFGKEGSYKIISTSIGKHIVHIQDQKFLSRDNKYQTAIIRVPITPSQDTQDDIYSEVTDILAANKSMESLKTAVGDKQSELSAFVNQNDFSIGSLGGDKASRDMVKWLFDSDTDIGEVSAEIYTYSDPNFYYNNKYVLMGLNAINEKGLMSVEAARDQIEFLVKNNLKGDKIVGQISGTDLNAISSKFGQTVQNVAAANLNSTTITGLGNEPKVLAAASYGDLNAASAPIVGNSGVYIIKPTNRTEGSTAGNIPSLRTAANNKDRARVGGGLINAIKKTAKVEDSRLSLDF